MKPWTDTYKPTILKDVLGQDTALAKLTSIINNKQVAIIHGPPGTGKTASIYALANDLGYEILELNASDFRNSERIHSIIGTSLNQASLFHKGKIILIDELEGLSGTEDRGGLQELASLLDTRNYAVILTINNPWDKKFSTIRKKAMLIEYPSIRNETIAKILKRVCEKEHIHFLEEDLKMLARRSGGDARAAINDLQTACSGKNELTKDDINQLTEREHAESVFTALRIILKGKDPRQSENILDSIDIDFDEMMLWLEENIAHEYRGKDLEQGYAMLAQADLFKGRIRKWQYWRFLVYMKALMSAGVTVAKDRDYPGYTPYKRHGRILKIWMANQKNKKKKDIAEKIARQTHTSSKEARKLVPYLKHLYAQGKSITIPFTEEETEWLKQ